MTTSADSTETRDFTGASFYAYLQEGKLMGVRCNDCGRLSAEPRPMCPDCHGRNMSWYEFAGTGSLGAFTCISVVPQVMADRGYGRGNPYCTGIVALDEGPRISAAIVGVDAANPQNIRTGMALVADFSEVDAEHPTLTFRPA